MPNALTSGANTAEWWLIGAMNQPALASYRPGTGCGPGFCEDTGKNIPEVGTSATGSGGDAAYREALVPMQGRAGGLGG